MTPCMSSAAGGQYHPTEGVPSMSSHFNETVHERGYITLGQAQQYAGELPADKFYNACGCYTCYSPSCPSCCLGTSCFINFGVCLLYNPFMCACPDDRLPGSWSCTDLKGQNYRLVPVDEDGTLGWFSAFRMEAKQEVSCYCTRVC